MCWLEGDLSDKRKENLGSSQFFSDEYAAPTLFIGFAACLLQSCVTLTAAMVKEKGSEHAHVVQQEEPKTPRESTKVKCKYCELVFTATATRIRAHLLGWTGSGV